jgi:hypothetical protein
VVGDGVGELLGSVMMRSMVWIWRSGVAFAWLFKLQAWILVIIKLDYLYGLTTIQSDVCSKVKTYPCEVLRPTEHLIASFLL